MQKGVFFILIFRKDDINGQKKKYPKLPNGFGSIKYLGSNRRNPFAVHPPTTEFRPNGSLVTPKALDYVDDWYYGFSILMACKAGTYVKDEYPPKPSVKVEDSNLDSLVQHILADYGRSTGEEQKLFQPSKKSIRGSIATNMRRITVGPTPPAVRHLPKRPSCTVQPSMTFLLKIYATMIFRTW